MQIETAGASGIILSAEGVRREFEVGRAGVAALRGVSVAVRAGETVAITGPSGAGKSTLLHILGGLDRPTAGRVRLRGQDLFAMSSAQRTRLRVQAIGIVFQFFHLLPELDVLENVMLPVMGLRGAWRHNAEYRRRAMDLLEQVGLAQRARHRPNELSGGEQQRAAIARALVNAPEIVLADEPTGNLDTATGTQVLNNLFALTHERRHTLVLVTHNEALAARCDRTIRLRDGVLDA